MIRLIGILTGAAIAIGLLIVALGVPELSEREPETEALLPPTSGQVPELVEAVLPAIEPETVPAPDQAPAGSDLPVAELPPPEPELTDEQLVEQIFTPQPQPLLDEHWYAFWSPVRSEMAANGFVARLQQTTGMDYRVVKLKPGVYEAAFAYTDQDDIEQKLARISAATGLDMSGG